MRRHWVASPLRLSSPPKRSPARATLPEPPLLRALPLFPPRCPARKRKQLLRRPRPPRNLPSPAPASPVTEPPPPTPPPSSPPLAPFRIPRLPRREATWALARRRRGRL